MPVPVFPRHDESTLMFYTEETDQRQGTRPSWWCWAFQSIPHVVEREAGGTEGRTTLAKVMLALTDPSRVAFRALRTPSNV